MEIKHGKHVTLICSLNIGDTVITDVGGYKTEGKLFKITDIRRGYCESGFQVKLDEYPNYIDSNWVDLKPLDNRE